MSDIEIRQARAGDRAAVLAFCEHTWEWGDYIETVWDAWLNDPAGQLLVALDNGQPVGIVHVFMQNATDAWQEGMRVAPDHRQQGIARKLSFEAGAEAIRRGATTVRLLTDASNVASIHMIEQAHFRRVGVFTPASAEPLTHPSRRVYGLEEPVLAVPEDLADVVNYLNVSNLFPAVGGLYYAGFVGYRISDTLLKGQIQNSQVYLLRRWERLDGIAIVEPREGRRGKYLFIGYIDGTTESISLLAYALRRRLPDLGLDTIHTNVPDMMMVRDAFTGASYTLDTRTFYTYERGMF